MTVNNNYKITHSPYFLTIANCETADSQPATTRSFFDGLFWAWVGQPVQTILAGL